jgi:hypothetical protein
LPPPHFAYGDCRLRLKFLTAYFNSNIQGGGKEREKKGGGRWSFTFLPNPSNIGGKVLFKIEGKWIPAFSHFHQNEKTCPILFPFPPFHSISSYQIKRLLV